MVGDPGKFIRNTYPYAPSDMDGKKRALALTAGLQMLPDGFVCELCCICKGTGKSPYERFTGCRYCGGHGLTQADSAPAFDSQRIQVLEAASRNMLVADVEVR